MYHYWVPVSLKSGNILELCALDVRDLRMGFQGTHTETPQASISYDLHLPHVPMLQLNFVVRALIKMVFGATLGPGSHAVGVNMMPCRLQSSCACRLRHSCLWLKPYIASVAARLISAHAVGSAVGIPTRSRPRAQPPHPPSGAGAVGAAPWPSDPRNTRAAGATGTARDSFCMMCTATATVIFTPGCSEPTA